MTSITAASYDITNEQRLPVALDGSQVLPRIERSSPRIDSRRYQMAGSARKRKLLRRVLVPVLVIVLYAAIWIVAFETSRVYRNLSVEAGTVLHVDDFLRIQDQGAFFTTDSDDIVTGDSFKVRTPGEYEVYVRSGISSHKVLLDVKDTVPPELEVQSLTYYTNLKDDDLTVTDFVVGTSDESEVSVEYSVQPDLTKEGPQTVFIKATDEGGNTTEAEASLYLIIDTEAPTVTAESWGTFIGEPIVYRQHVSVSDDIDDDPVLDIDNSQVDTENEGTYNVVYTAIDKARNVSSVTVTLTLKEHAYDLDTLYELCDEVLDDILSPDMSKREICEAIYYWTRFHLQFAYSPEKEDWVKAAYLGLTERKGDCYIFASTAKALLTRAGIKNIDIEMIPDGDRLHYWSIVDIEDGHGWYHFDTTPIDGAPYLCLVTDEELMDSDEHSLHVYDRSRYPVIP